MKHPLLKSVEKIDGDLTALRQDAGEKYRAMETAQKAVAEATERGDQITPDSPLFQALDTAGKDYGALSDKITAQETVKAGLIAQMGQSGIEPGSDGGSSSDYVAEVRELLASGGVWPGAQRQSPGERVASGQRYADVVASGNLGAQRYGSDIPLGEALDREQLAALLTGADPGSAGAFITPDRQGYYPLPLRPLTFLDLITIGRTDSDLVEFVRMLSLTNAAAEVPEAVSAATIGDGTGGTVTAVQGGRKPESGMTFQIVQEAVSTIAHWVPATKRALSDAGQLRTIIDGALTWGLGDRLERQLIAGNGVGENLLGLLNQPGIGAVPAGPKSAADKIHNAITLNRIAGFASTGVVMNPTDAEGIWLSRENTGGPGTGGYLFGNPNNVGPRTLWGLPVAETPAVPAGTAVVGNLRAFIFWLREGAQIVASDSHVDFFTRNLVAVLAEMRGGAGLPMPESVSEVNLAAA